MQKILVSGAGIGGLALAFWLQRAGHTVTIVERASNLRTGGYKIDIRGVAVDVVKAMGIYEKIYKKRTAVQSAAEYDIYGKHLKDILGDDFGMRVNEDVEILREDLCRIEHAALQDGIEYIFGNSITKITETADGVEVEFTSASRQKFDLVIGADGLHSNVRQLVFGDEHQFTHDLGYYICIYSIPNILGLERSEALCINGEKLINIYCLNKEDRAKAAFLLPMPQEKLTDRAAKEAYLRQQFADVKWVVPEVLDWLSDTDDLYFDTITQVYMETWSKGRIALVGDAGYCPSPMSGQGSSLALVGAYVLAGELAACAGDYAQAFTNYHNELKSFVQENQQVAVYFAESIKSGVTFGENLEENLEGIGTISNGYQLKSYPHL